MEGDTGGYAWGRRNERTALPITNVKPRQTDYGGINRYHQAFLVTPGAGGNGESTVSLLKDLQALHPDKKLILMWDGASYHSSEAVQTYFTQVTPGVEDKDGKVTCLVFAPNAPDQNPVEEGWLQGKNFLRRHFYENKTFKQIKSSFLNFLNKKIFNFEKTKWYFEIPQPV